jgi:hypothetical protein
MDTDQRLIGGELRLRDGGVRLGQNPPLELDDERRFQRFDIVGKVREGRVHAPNTNPR